MTDLHIRCLPFVELSNEELYALLQLRSGVFVVEQQCVYQDMDDADQQALHVLGTMADKLVCYARLLGPGNKYPTASIGRVVSAPEARRLGHGRDLMSCCIEYCQQHWPGVAITVSAQRYLEKFYRDFGFRAVRGPYLEDGIPHLEMVLELLPQNP